MSAIDRWSKFTKRAWDVLRLAQEEAERLHHNYIGTEHLLLGLIREREGLAGKVLSELGVQLDQARSSLESIVGGGRSAPHRRSVLGQIRNSVASIVGRRSCTVHGETGLSLTPRVKRVIELAADETQHLKHDYIGTEHLLLGLIREGGGVAIGMLESLGVSPERVRTQTLRELGQQ